MGFLTSWNLRDEKDISTAILSFLHDMSER